MYKPVHNVSFVIFFFNFLKNCLFFFLFESNTKTPSIRVGSYPTLYEYLSYTTRWSHESRNSQVNVESTKGYRRYVGMFYLCTSLPPKCCVLGSRVKISKNVTKRATTILE